MIDINAYDHFSFDLWMTIIKSNPRFKPYRVILFKNFFEINKEIEVINDTIKYYDHLFNEITQITGKHFHREEAFLMILDALGVDIESNNKSELQAFFTESDSLFLDNLPEIIWPNVFGVLETIKNEGKTANILSNTAFIHGDILRVALGKIGLADYFSFMIFSDEVGVSKPNKEIFNILLEKIKDMGDVAKNKIVHIGDNRKADIIGALEYGINAELIKF
ncbi:HAD family hydrolase [Chryseobacterium sp. T1]